MTRISRIPAALLLVAVALVAQPASARTTRVALIGDSLAYGAGDEHGKGIAGRLGAEMRSRGIAPPSTANFGVNGATTQQVEEALQEPSVRSAVKRADAIILSAGANDVRRFFADSREFRSPIGLAGEVLGRLERIVGEVRQLNPKARILILGAYAPLPYDRAGPLLEPFIALWDTMLARRFARDERVDIVRMSDIVNAPGRLSRIDSFHPSGEAYQALAARIADMLARAE